MLPGLSGEDILPEIQGLPVIVVSARADTEDKVGLLLGGAADYITKPFDPRELPVSYTHLDVYKRQDIHSGVILLKFPILHQFCRTVKMCIRDRCSTLSFPEVSLEAEVLPTY